MSRANRPFLIGWVASWLKGRHKAPAKNGDAGARHLAVGRIGERAACRELWKRGYRILERNFRCTEGEIDIICEKHCIVYFVEVKTRTGPDGAADAAIEAVDEDKRRRLRSAARTYLSRFDAEGLEVRFKVLTVALDERLKPCRVEVFED
ncbi:MAG: hypothetical protein Kow0059_17490 [Candidatus Sumerlaeia bacterium]